MSIADPVLVTRVIAGKTKFSDVDRPTQIGVIVELADRGHAPQTIRTMLSLGSSTVETALRDHGLEVDRRRPRGRFVDRIAGRDPRGCPTRQMLVVLGAA